MPSWAQEVGWIPNLSWAHFPRVDLSRSTLENSKFRGTVLREADLRGSNLSYANFREADLRRADLRDVNFEGTEIEGADLHGAASDDERCAPPVASAPGLHRGLSPGRSSPAWGLPADGGPPDKGGALEAVTLENRRGFTAISKADWSSRYVGGG